MEIITIEKDIKVLYVTAKSFPEYIGTAHETLHSIIPFSLKRRYFGLSRPEGGDGVIVYKAAAEEISEDHGKNYNLQTMLLKKGNYRCITISNYAQDISSISKAFQEILTLPDIDQDGYCVEWYYNEKDVKCLVRLTSDNNVKEM